MTRPVRGISDDNSRRKESKTDAPPPEFDKERLTVSEIDPDAQSKWRALRQNPTEVESNEPAPTPMQAMGSQQTYAGNTTTSTQPITQTSDTTYVPPPAQNQTDLPSSYNFYYEERNIPPPSQTSTDSDTSSSSDQGTTSDESKTTKEPTLEKKETKESLKTPQKVSEKEPFKKEFPSSKEPKTLPKTPVSTKAEKVSVPATKKKTDLDTKEQFISSEKESKTSLQQPKKKQDVEANVSSHKESERAPQKEKDKDKTTSKVEAPVQAHSIQLTPDIQQQAFHATQSVASYLNPKVEALYQNMVGAIILTKKSGIEKTEVLLNQPNLKSSQFYGSRVTLTRYSTNPYSVNIALSTPNPKALTQFSNHLDSLRTAFIQGNFDFKVGRLEAHYISDKKEHYIFKRKEGASEKDSGSEKEKE